MTTSSTSKRRTEEMEGIQTHIRRVHTLLHQVARELATRGLMHDASKLQEPELEAFLQAANLRDLVYGSEEYRAAFKQGLLPAAIKHHYEMNDHHPEHFPGGIRDMNLMQLTEMLCDWKAANERHNNAPFAESFPINGDRFQIDHQLYCVLVNTALALGMISEEEARELR